MAGRSRESTGRTRRSHRTRRRRHIRNNSSRRSRRQQPNRNQTACARQLGLSWQLDDQPRDCRLPRGLYGMYGALWLCHNAGTPGCDSGNGGSSKRSGRGLSCRGGVRRDHPNRSSRRRRRRALPPRLKARVSGGAAMHFAVAVRLGRCGSHRPGGCKHRTSARCGMYACMALPSCSLRLDLLHRKLSIAVQEQRQVCCCQGACLRGNVTCEFKCCWLALASAALAGRHARTRASTKTWSTCSCTRFTRQLNPIVAAKQAILGTALKHSC